MDFRPEKSEESETFVVRVNRPEGGPWTGSITWVTGGGYQKFGSMQEMLQLMDGAVPEARPKGGR